MAYVMNWNAKAIIDLVDFHVEEVCKEGAEMVKREAQSILRTVPKTHSMSPLADQIEIRVSKYKGGGYIVGAQLPGAWKRPYRAGFLELGTLNQKNQGKRRKHDMKGIPYLRPARKRNMAPIKRKFKKRLGAK